ncbi:MAG: saccharopine dehydrogenase family protein [Anaerolineae bacterium]|jgi:saccharopine dehydrogenase-like NADP-dependent oxidoreductase
MKVIVLGGAGDMGSQTVETLARHPEVRRITIADRNVAGAEALACRLTGSGPEVLVRPMDARNHADVVEALRGHDVAASALGPFYRFEMPLVRAAIEAGVDYVSICDDWIAAKQVVEELDTLARQRGRRIVVGLGTSPGLSNLAAAYLARQMDQPLRVTITVYQPPEAGQGMAVLQHVLFIFGGPAPVWRDGQLEMVRAGRIVREVELPMVGRMRVWNAGHAEPVTLPRHFPTLEEVTFLMSVGAWTHLFLWLGRLRLTATPERIDRVANVLARLLPTPKAGMPEPPGALRVDVEGIREGQPVHRMLCGVGQMRPATGVPLALGAVMLARGQVLTTEGGVYGPEAIIDPVALLRGLREETGLQAYTNGGMTQPLEV